MNEPLGRPTKQYVAHLEARVAALEEELRVREESQVPLIRLDNAETRVAALEQRNKILAEVAAEAEAEEDDLAARVAAMEEALRIYVDPCHWGIEKMDHAQKALVWIGPGATTRGVPDGMEVARQALAMDSEE